MFLCGRIRVFFAVGFGSSLRSDSVLLCGWIQFFFAIGSCFSLRSDPVFFAVGFGSSLLLDPVFLCGRIQFFFAVDSGFYLRSNPVFICGRIRIFFGGLIQIRCSLRVRSGPGQYQPGSASLILETRSQLNLKQCKRNQGLKMCSVYQINFYLYLYTTFKLLERLSIAELIQTSILPTTLAYNCTKIGA